ncbi:MAG: peptidoglycan bridge formation glycyltransferase FemA/FemB family protein, partial [Patescibacteria group bacterium]
MREVKEITSEQKWNTFVDGAGAHTFLQSWEWGELGRAMGSKIWRLGVLENGKIEGVMLAVKVEARRGRFLFVPHGPIINWANGEAFDLLIRELKKIAKEEN